jgi:hypothetical protein
MIFGDNLVSLAAYRTEGYNRHTGHHSNDRAAATSFLDRHAPDLKGMILGGDAA